MERSIEGGRWTVTLRPRKRVRFFGTGFLVPWLAVWAIGEAFALGVLLSFLGVPGGARLLRFFTTLARSTAPALVARFAWIEVPGRERASPLSLAFISSWLAIWTAAGVLAAHQMLRLLTSEDRIHWDGEGVEVVRRMGPFRRRRTWRAEHIEHLSMSRPDRALLIHTKRSTHPLTEWGSKAQRASLRDELKKTLGSGARGAAGAGPEVPAGWAASPAPEGATLLVRDPGGRRARAAAAWLATVAIAGGAAYAYARGIMDAWWGDRAELGLLGTLIVAILAAAGSVWLSLGGTRILVNQGTIEFRPGPLAGGSSAILKKVHLAVEHTTDDDGDDWFELQARSGEQRRTIDRRMNESRRVLHLARWIAERSGAPLDLGRGVEDGEESDEALAA